jgi:hypothetical protein
MSAKRPVALLVHLEEVGCDIIIVNVLADRVQGSAARHLNPRLADHDVHSITPGASAAARPIRDCVHEMVGLSPRITESHRDVANALRLSHDLLHE